MNIICLQKNLKKALNIVERIIGRNLTLPILNNILLTVENNKLKLSSTNLEIGINCWIPGKIEEKGSITVPAKLINNFINNLPNENIELKVKDNQLDLKCNKFKSIIKGLSADDFPIIPKIKSDAFLLIKSDLLKNSFAQVVDMASVSESRPEISGVYMNFNNDSIKLAATDSFRLAEKNIQINTNKLKDQKIIIPQRTIFEVIRILGEKDEQEQEQDVKIVLSDNQILFDLGYTQVISRLIDGQYPDYQQIIPDSVQTEVTVNRSELINNIKIASLFTGKVNDIKLLVDPKKSIIEVISKDANIGENKSKLKAEIKGKEVEVIFNYRYILDGLNNIYSDNVVIGLNDNSKPVSIRPVGDINYTYIVMPIKV